MHADMHAYDIINDTDVDVIDITGADEKLHLVVDIVLRKVRAITHPSRYTPR